MNIISTTTTVVETPAVINMTVKLRDASEIVDRLTKILMDHATWTDPLSKRLFKWGAKTMQIASTTQDEKRYVEIANKRIGILLDKILVNPLDQSRLKNPYLDREWVWEKEALDSYKRLTNRSPFDGKEIQETPHLFAKEMIEWAASLPDLGNAESDRKVMVADTASTSLVTAILKAEANPNRVTEIVLLAQKTISAEKVRESRLQVVQATKALAKLKVHIQEEIKKETEAAQKRAAEHENVVTQKIDSLEKTHKRISECFQSQLDFASKRLDFAQNQLNTAQELAASQQAQIRDLQQKYNEARQQVRDLSNQDGGGCTIL